MVSSPRLAVRLLVFSLTIQTTTFAADEPYSPPNKVHNAALVYWQAFSLMSLPDNESALMFDRLVTGEYSRNNAKALLSGFKPSLDLIQSIKPDTACRWEIIQQGPGTLLPHLSKARMLARALIVQARDQLEENQQSAAMDSLASAILLARNIDEGGLIQLLVGMSIESMAADVVEETLPKLTQTTRDQFFKSLQKLPPRASFAGAMRFEKNTAVAWLRPLLAADPKTATEAVTTILSSEYEQDIKKLLGSTNQERQANLNQFIEDFDRVIQAAQLPPEEAISELKKQEDLIPKSDSALTRLLMPVTSKAYQRYHESSQRVAKLNQLLQDNNDSQ